jgi:hypothetical protein
MFQNCVPFDLLVSEIWSSKFWYRPNISYQIRYFNISVNNELEKLEKIKLKNCQKWTQKSDKIIKRSKGTELRNGLYNDINTWIVITFPLKTCRVSQICYKEDFHFFLIKMTEESL